MDRTKIVLFLLEECLRELLIIASLLTVIGIVLLYTSITMFGAISIFLYTSIYTFNDLVVCFVGFFRTIPFMLGWVAATGEFGIEAGTLFLIQFWQFPHFGLLDGFV
jgi:protoheme IX farnesyltransferase